VTSFTHGGDATGNILAAPCDGCTDIVSEDAKGRVRRRLAAIMIAGYSPLLPREEADSFAGLKAV